MTTIIFTYVHVVFLSSKRILVTEIPSLMIVAIQVESFCLDLFYLQRREMCISECPFLKSIFQIADHIHAFLYKPKKNKCIPEWILFFTQSLSHLCFSQDKLQGIYKPKNKCIPEWIRLIEFRDLYIIRTSLLLLLLHPCHSLVRGRIPIRKELTAVVGS
jgi:ribosomal protein L39E